MAVDIHSKRNPLSVELGVLPLILSMLAGYIDTAGFLALQGLFTAHVTGNFVTLGAALVHGHNGVIAKILALPVFCLVAVLGRLTSTFMEGHSSSALRDMIAFQTVLLTAAAVVAIRFGPFPNVDAPLAITTGMVLVAAMAIQNAAHRLHLGAAPPSTLMTGTTTQIMIDMVDLWRGPAIDARPVLTARLGRMSLTVLVFAFGCAIAAMMFLRLNVWCFAFPPVLGLAATGLAHRGRKSKQ